LNQSLKLHAQLSKDSKSFIYCIISISLFIKSCHSSIFFGRICTLVADEIEVFLIIGRASCQIHRWVCCSFIPIDETLVDKALELSLIRSVTSLCILSSLALLKPSKFHYLLLQQQSLVPGPLSDDGNKTIICSKPETSTYQKTKAILRMSFTWIIFKQVLTDLPSIYWSFAFSSLLQEQASPLQRWLHLSINSL